MMFDPAELEIVRLRGDPRADEVIADLFASRSLEAVNGLLMRLVATDDVPPEDLPPSVRAYFDDTASAARAGLDPADQRAAERLFAAFGPEILLGLGAYSLPMCYAVGRAAPVLLETARLVHGTRRRVFETTQFVVDCFGPGGLGPTGRGFRSAQKVRLMHAAVRRLLLSDPLRPWDMGLGVPINQMDLGYTLHTFDGLVLDGLGKLGIEVAPEAADAWHACWFALGRVLGTDDDLLCRRRDDADAFGAHLGALLCAPSAAGRELTAALIEMFQAMIPGDAFDGLTPAIMRHYLSPDVVQMLAIPESQRMGRLWRLAVGAGQPALDRQGDGGRLGTLLRRFNQAFIDALVLMERGPRRSPFGVPGELADGWRGEGPGG